MKKKLLIPFLLLLLTFTVFGTTSVSAASKTAATIGSKKYTSLGKAVDAVKDGQTIKLKKDISYKKQNLTVDRSKVKFTLDLNGHTLKFKSGHGLVVKKGNMTVKGKDGTIALDHSKVKSGGTLTLKSGTYKGYLENKGTTKISGGTFKSISLDNLGKGTLKISGGTFSRPDLYNCKTMEISGGTFSKLLLYNHKTMKISGGTFKNFQKGIDDGMIINTNKLTVSGGSFKMAQEGYVFVNWGGTTTLKGATVRCTKGEVLANYGAKTSKTSITGGKYISKNDLMSVGGGNVNIKGGTFKLTGGSSTVIMKAGNGGKITVSGGTFSAPKSYAYCVKTYGMFESDKIYNEDGTVKIKGGNFKSVKVRKKTSRSYMPSFLLGGGVG